MSDETPKPDGRGKSPGSLGALRPPKEGEPPRNPKGTNGWDARRRTLLDFMAGKSADPEKTRIEKVLLATYTNSLTPRGAVDRKILLEQVFGKAREQVDLSNSDGSLGPKILEVRWVDVKPAETTPHPVPDGTGTGTSGS